MDGLRAVAVLPVILFHAGFETFRGGFVGVDVFFVISGYLITGILLADLRAGQFSLARFYERRARRILPALFLVMLACLPFAWAWLAPRDWVDFLESLAAVALFGSNLLFRQETGYFGGASELKPLLHTWSLAVEEQYYLLFPLGLLLAWRYAPRRILPACAVLAAVSFALALWALGADPEGGFYLLPPRVWELLAGAMLALWMADGDRRPLGRGVAEAGALAGVALLAWAVARFNQWTPFPSTYTLVPVAGTVLLLRCATERTMVGRALAHPLLVGIGLISYSAYLWHQPLIALARHRELHHPGPVVLGLLALASLGLAWVSWRFVERPFRDPARVSRRQVVLFGVAASAFFLLLGVAGTVTDGYAALRYSGQQRAMIAAVTPTPGQKGCALTARDRTFPPPREACEYHEGHLAVAVFGDSHSMELAQAVAGGIRGDGLRIKQFSMGGCGPFFGRTVEGFYHLCSEWTQAAADEIAGNPALRTVIVAWRLPLYLFGEHEWTWPELSEVTRPRERDRRWASHVGLLRHLVDHGKRVILVLPAPELPKSMGWLVHRAGASPDTIPGVPRAWWDARMAYVTSRQHEIPSEVRVVDPTPLFCDRARCLAAAGGVGFYSDANHLSPAGIRIVTREILPHLR